MLCSAGVEPIDRVSFEGEGLSWRVYRASCVQADGGQRTLVVRLPQPDCGADQPERVRRERRLLDHLAQTALPIRLPKPVTEVPLSSGQLASVQEYLSGFPLEMRASRAAPVEPWEILAQLAAACHALDPDSLEEFLPGYTSRRDHALTSLKTLEASALPEAEEMVTWARCHLPPARPARLLHGDLLGQNVRLDPFGEALPGLLDFSEAQLGDPAYDLAIITRGVRRPFQIEGGFERLLDAYNAQDVEPVQAGEVRLYELCFLVNWYGQEVDSYGAHAGQGTLNQIRNILLR